MEGVGGWSIGRLTLDRTHAAAREAARGSDDAGSESSEPAAELFWSVSHAFIAQFMR